MSAYREIEDLRTKIEKNILATFQDSEVATIEFNHKFVVWQQSEDEEGLGIKIPVVLESMDADGTLYGRYNDGDCAELPLSYLDDIVELAYIIDQLTEGRYKIIA